MTNKVKEYRDRLGWTQEHLSLVSNVPQTTISEIERQIRVPGIDIALMLAKALGTTVEDLFLID